MGGGWASCHESRSYLSGLIDVYRNKTRCFLRHRIRPCLDGSKDVENVDRDDLEVKESDEMVAAEVGQSRMTHNYISLYHVTCVSPLWFCKFFLSLYL